jgi:hypothetical protein
MKKIISEKEIVEMLESRLVNLKAEVSRTEEALSILKRKESVIDSPNQVIKSAAAKIKVPTSYDHAGKWDHKILYALSKTGAAYKEDIIAQLKKLDPSQDMDKLAGTVAVKLSHLLKAQVISASRNGRKLKYTL